MRAALIWTVGVAVLLIPLGFAASSPLLAWRDPIYIAAGLAGVVAMLLLLVQPALVGGYVPGLSGLRARRIHRIVGLSLSGAVLVHVLALWITSPPDVMDALLFASPTAFTPWGVIAMWAVFATAFLAIFWRKLRISPRVWRGLHTALGMTIVGGTVAHALLIEGTMEAVSKAVLSLVIVVVTLKLVVDLRTRAKR